MAPSHGVTRIFRRRADGSFRRPYGTCHTDWTKRRGRRRRLPITMTMPERDELWANFLLFLGSLEEFPTGQPLYWWYAFNVLATEII